MENLNLIISKNLIKYRVLAGLTQLELANKINYSDKSISKWERGEGLPDISVLVKLSEIYNITLNDFLIQEVEKQPQTQKVEKKSKLLISFLSTGLVVLIASICFAILFIIPSTKSIAWFSYLFSIPVCAIVLLVFSEVWGNRYLNTLFSSIIIWGIILSICLTVKISDIWIICIIGIVLNILVIFWYILRHVHIQKQTAKKIFKAIFGKSKKENIVKQKLNKKTKQRLVFNNIIEENTNVEIQK